MPPEPDDIIIEDDPEDITQDPPAEELTDQQRLAAAQYIAQSAGYKLVPADDDQDDSSPEPPADDIYIPGTKEEFQRAVEEKALQVTGPVLRQTWLQAAMSAEPDMPDSIKKELKEFAEKAPIQNVKNSLDTRDFEPFIKAKMFDYVKDAASKGELGNLGWAPVQGAGPLMSPQEVEEIQSFKKAFPELAGNPKFSDAELLKEIRRQNG